MIAMGRNVDGLMQDWYLQSISDGDTAIAGLPTDGNLLQ